MAIPSHAVIVTAAGASERFNGDSEREIKKEYLSIDGHTVLWRSVAPFLEVPNCKAIFVTYPDGMEGECGIALEDLLDQNHIPIILVKGGEDRQQSVYNALKTLSTMSLPIEFVAIHDGARAFITLSLIIRTLATAKVFGASVPAVPPTDALKIIDENGIITHHIDRNQAVGMQTPQIFRYPEIWKAHQQAHSSEKQYVDDTEIYSDYGGTVGISEGDRSNRKITWLEDIPDAHKQIEQYLELLEEAKKIKKVSSLFQQSVQEYQREHGT